MQVSRLHQVMEYDQDGTPTFPKKDENEQTPEPKEVDTPIEKADQEEKKSSDAEKDFLNSEPEASVESPNEEV